MKIDTPVKALTQKPHIITGYMRSSGFSGVFGQRPSSAMLIIAAPPATIDMPSVCANRYIGNAQMLFDSRTQVL